ncbi:MAG: hypothetical protein RLZZ299_2946 [Pseudomonadota bacterium]
MLAQLGSALVLAAMGCAMAGTICALAAGRTRSAEAWRWARRGAYGFAACILAATWVMEVALVRHDFGVRYVAQVGSLSTPLHITIVSLWSSLEGSILFWGAILGVYVAVATYANGERDPDVMTWATATWLATATFFCLLLAGPAHPFLPVPSPVPPDGPGPNPLLQNHPLMIIHPPMLYLGYVGMAIPFGHAVGALVAGRLGAAQLQPMRRALLVPWGFLTAGIVLGGWWAYEVLGWGGYWAWDPVENASLLPWLTATTALHAAMLPQRRGAMKAWTLTLVLASYLLTVLGTFMTRSGVFNSVHSFSQSDIGPTILVFLALCTVMSLLLLAARVDRLEGEGDPPAPVSRESAFLLNNLLFVALTFTVLLGTVFPLVVEAVRGTKLSVGEPYFNKMAVPMGVAILFLMGIGPALPWGRPSGARVWETLRAPLAAGGGAALVGAGLGVTAAWPLVTLVAAGIAGWVTLRELRGTISGGRRLLRRTGAYVVHAGVIVMIVAIAISHAYRTDRELELTRGACVAFGGHELCYVGARDVAEPNRTRRVADVKVDGRDALEPALVVYPRMGSPIGSPAVLSTPSHDFYVSLMNLSPDGATAGFHLFRNPLVPWLWVGAGIAALGTVLAAWPVRGAARADGEAA